MSNRFETVASPTVAERELRGLVTGAEEELLLSSPRSVVKRVRPALEDAVDRGVLVLVLLADSTVEDDPASDDTDIASVLNVWENAGTVPVVATADDRAGLCIESQVFDRTGDPDDGIVFEHPTLKSQLFTNVVGNIWVRATEVHVSDPDPLPASYESFSLAITNAIRHLRADQFLDAEVEGTLIDSGEPVTVAGRVCNVRQSIVSPITSSFPVENSLWIRQDGDLVTVGGPGAFLEDVEASQTTLRARE